MRLPGAFAIAAFTAGSPTVPLLAAPHAGPPAVSVRYDARELRSADGVRGVYSRVQQAAQQACGALPPLDRWRTADRHRCQAQTLERAVRTVGAAPLTAHHRACQRHGTCAGS